MPFTVTFKLTTPSEGMSMVTTLLPAVELSPGIYDEGLLTVLDSELAMNLAREWQWLIQDDARPIAATGFGDFFFFSEKHQAAYFIQVQKGKCTFVDRSIDVFFNDFLCIEGVRKEVLSQERMSAVAAHAGALEYGQCYIAKPWECIGGSGKVDTFGKGDLHVYANLMSQTLKQWMDAAKVQAASDEKPGN